MNNAQTSIPTNIKLNYKFQKGSDELIVLLHGYEQNAELCYKLFSKSLETEKSILIPNGPFPLPKRKKDSYTLNYAWYFYDHLTDYFLIDYSFPAEILSKLILYLGNFKSITIVGYSQGGYLAPFLGQELKQTKKVIGINCRFRHDMLQKHLNFKLVSIHGKKDGMVDPQLSFASYEALKSRGNDIEFHWIESGTHRINDDYITALKSSL